MNFYKMMFVFSALFVWGCQQGPELTATVGANEQGTTQAFSGKFPTHGNVFSPSTDTIPVSACKDSDKRKTFSRAPPIGGGYREADVRRGFLKRLGSVCIGQLRLPLRRRSKRLRSL